MEDNINEVLGVTDNSVSPMHEQSEHKINNGAENTLITIATIVLICGIISTIICLFTITIVKKPQYYGGTTTEFSAEGFLISVVVLLSSLTSWALMRVLANISLTLKNINNKIK